MVGSKESPAGKPEYDIAQMSIALVSGLTLAITALFICVAPLTGNIAGARDFVVYWATGQQLVHHANPYDVDTMMRIERGARAAYRLRRAVHAQPALGAGDHLSARADWGQARGLALVADSAGVPVGLGPHGVADAWAAGQTAQLSWLLVCAGAGVPDCRANFDLCAAGTGAVSCAFIARGRFWRELSLWLCALKPHLFLVFGVVLLAWVVVSRSYKVLLGAATALAASSRGQLGLWIRPPGPTTAT